MPPSHATAASQLHSTFPASGMSMPSCACLQGCLGGPPQVSFSFPPLNAATASLLQTILPLDSRQSPHSDIHHHKIHIQVSKLFHTYTLPSGVELVDCKVHNCHHSCFPPQQHVKEMPLLYTTCLVMLPWKA